MFVPNQDYEILTPDGFAAFAGLQCILRSTVRVFDGDCCVLEGSARHRVHTLRGWVMLQDLRVGDRIGARSVTRLELGPEQPLYDPIDVDHPEQAFNTGDVVSHNCSFQGSANTLIPAWKLSQLNYRDPIEVIGDLRVYTKPVRQTDETASHIYVVTVDIATGQGLDYSTINVTDISVNPFVQVAIWRNNTLTAAGIAPMIRDIGQHYNNAYVLVEINFEGLAVADMLHNDLEYPSVISILPHPKKGQQLAGGFGPRNRFGLKMTEATKRIGCSGLRTLIEKDKYIINDYQTLRELTTFVAHNKSFAAEEGYHDDCVSCLILLGWLTLQYGFENYVGLSMRRLLMDRHEPVTFDTEPLGILGDLDLPTILGHGPSGHEIVDDERFWQTGSDPELSWL